VQDEEDEPDSEELQPSSGESAARDPCTSIAARLMHFLRGAKLPLLLVIIAVLSALTKIGINSFTGLFWHFRREITNYLISNVGNWLAVLYWIAHGVTLLCAAVYWTSKFGLQAIGSGSYLLPWSFHVALTCIGRYSRSQEHFVGELHPPLSQHALTVLSQGSNPRNFLTTSCFFSKVVGLSLAVASGLQIGSEGPDIHIAVIISRMLISSSYFSFALRSKDATKLVFTAAAAAGVATSFGAPMSGVMFTVEIVGSYFVVSHYTSMFTASMVAGSVFMLLNNLVQDNPLIDSEYNLTNCNTVLQSALFKAICSIKNYTPIYKYVTTQSKLVFISSFWNLLAYVFIGAVFGLLSAAYIGAQAKLRAALQPVMQRHRYLLPVVVAIVSGLLTFPGFTEFLSYMPKRSMQDMLLSRPLDSPTDPKLDLIAHANDWASTGSVIGSLAVYFVVKLVLLAFAIVLPIPCGFLGPIMTLGAAGGRFFGEIFVMWGMVNETVRPEAFAIAGAAAFATGMSRALVTPLLFFEMTGQINQPFSVFVAVITAYLVADKLSLSMYDTLGVIGSTFSMRQFKRADAISGQSSTTALSCPVYIGARHTDVIALSRSCR
jgi:H+/Cl- antiporter ClcA